MLYNTTKGYHQRTSSQQFYNKFATSQRQRPTSRHVIIVMMLGCGKFLSFGGVELLCARPLVVFVAGVRGSGVQHLGGSVVSQYSATVRHRSKELACCANGGMAHLTRQNDRRRNVSGLRSCERHRHCVVVSGLRPSTTRTEDIGLVKIAYSRPIHWLIHTSGIQGRT